MVSAFVDTSRCAVLRACPTVVPEKNGDDIAVANVMVGPTNEPLGAYAPFKHIETERRSRASRLHTSDEMSQHDAFSCMLWHELLSGHGMHVFK